LIPDVPADEFVARVILDVLEVVEISGVGQLVQVDDFKAGMSAEKIMDKVAADKAGTPGDEERLADDPPFFNHLSFFTL
jgi:hypothetical protein